MNGGDGVVHLDRAGELHVSSLGKPYFGAKGKTKGQSPARMPKTTDTPADTGAGKPADKAAPKRQARGSAGKTANPGSGEPVQEQAPIAEPGAPDPTESRPARAPRKGKSPDTPAATQPKPRKPRTTKSKGDAE